MTSIEKLYLSLNLLCLICGGVIGYGFGDITYRNEYYKGYCNALESEYKSGLCIKGNSIIHRF